MPQYLLVPENRKPPLARGIMLRKYLKAQQFPGQASPTDEDQTILLRTETILAPDIDRYIREDLKLKIRLI